MTRSPLLLLVAALAAHADEFVTPSPGLEELDRYALSRTPSLTIKLDTMTAASWYLCASPKGKGKQAWCRFKEIQGLTSGPAGRYRLSEGAPFLLLDTVSGRTWVRCEIPTAEKGEGWCAIDE
jgi:hypothetical protein